MYDEEFQYVYVFIKVSLIDNPFISNDFSLHYEKKTSRMADLFKWLGGVLLSQGETPNYHRR
ncbi:hypothetical protein [Peribacillus simplex]|uniref:hypothetical protein n=1 Tax=Peribacillus simplex TaxID=1478 RepID=UPI00366AD5E7